MRSIERRVAREAKEMTRRQVILKAIDGQISWLQAADILGMTARHLRRLRAGIEEVGWGALRDGRVGNLRRKRIPLTTIETILKLRRELYSDFSVKHFHERVSEKHGVRLSYTWTKHLLQAAGLAEKASARGKYRRKRERRPMVGMLVHLDASTHEWIAGLPMRDLVVALDDADGRILFARFFEQEGTLSTMEALESIFRRFGRFSEFYTDRGSHFCVTTEAGGNPDDRFLGQVPRVLRTLGIRQILARSPEARGRSERAFGTIQGRLPQELRAERIAAYDAANRYLEQIFIPDFNRRFTVRPAQRESAFTQLPEIDLAMLLSVQTERIVAKDNTVVLNKQVFQLEPTAHRLHFVRCPVLVHEHLDRTFSVSYQGAVIGRFGADGQPLRKSPTLAPPKAANRVPLKNRRRHTHVGMRSGHL